MIKTFSISVFPPKKACWILAYHYNNCGNVLFHQASYATWEDACFALERVLRLRERMKFIGKPRLYRKQENL